MNEKHSNEVDSRLSALLHEWKPGAELPPRFHEDVWRRIEQADAAPAGSPRLNWLQWIDALFARPAVAISYVVVLLVIGLSTGALQSRETTSRLDHALQARYLQSVDPYLKPR
jgi:hypothetical protein